MQQFLANLSFFFFFLITEGYKCPTCTANKARPITTEDKEVETTTSLGDLATTMESNNFNDCSTSLVQKDSDYDANSVTPEPYDKMCPICGEIFKKYIEFSEFQSHVEQHFIGETQNDSFINTLDNGHSSF